MSERMSVDWQRVPNDPDPEQDLGYDLAELTIVRSPTEDHVVFLPTEEDCVEDEAFIIADTELVTEPRR